jgi:hypothetical protein
VVSVSISPKSQAEFIAALRQFAANTGQTMRDSALEQAALACQDAATFTPPLPKGGGRGLSKAAQTAGENAVAGDIKKLYVAANDRSANSAAGLLANQLAYATKTNDLGLFNKIIGKGTLQALKGLPPIMRKIANDQDYDRAFKKAKNYFNTTNPVMTDYGQGFVEELRPPHDRIKGKFGGRIGKSVRPVKIKMLVESKSTLDQYIKDRQQMVGMIKAGWASALRSLPKPVINGIPKDFGVQLLKVAWINRHTRVIGKNNLTANEKVVELSVTNTQGNVNNIGVDASVLDLVYANRIKQMKARFERHMNTTIQQANRRK